MKKIITLLSAIIIAVFCFSFVVFAAQTFEDTIEDGLPKAFSYSDHMYFQYNEDLECTTLVKQSDTGSATTTENIVYKMDGDVTSFSLDCMHVNGLGNGLSDIKVYVSADTQNWTNVPIKATEQVFDDEIYIDFDHAYWVKSTVSNKAEIPAGNVFIKIEIQPFTVAESCTWNTVIDTVHIDYASDESNANNIVSSTNNGTTVQDSQTANSSLSTGMPSGVIIIICVAIFAVVAGAVIITVIVVKAKSNNNGKE